MKLRFMHLHSPLFLSGTNYGDKLPGSKGTLTMEADTWAEFGNQFAIKITDHNGIFTFMPFANTITCEPVQEIAKAPVKNAHKDHRPTAANAQIGGPLDVLNPAQVETPTQKVQGRPGRKPKFQGDEAQGE